MGMLMRRNRLARQGQEAQPKAKETSRMDSKVPGGKKRQELQTADPQAEQKSKQQQPKEEPKKEDK